MTTASQSAGAEKPSRADPHFSVAERVQLWAHFASTGGADKDRMITITNWLLAFSATIIGYLATQLVEFELRPYRLSDAPQAGILALLGILVSAFAVYIVQLYRTHAMWNWEKGDALAEGEPTLPMLLPEKSMRAPVFNIFFGLALTSLVVHAVVLVWSFQSG